VEPIKRLYAIHRDVSRSRARAEKLHRRTVATRPERVLLGKLIKEKYKLRVDYPETIEI
jgi:hypothetical protein